MLNFRQNLDKSKNAAFEKVEQNTRSKKDKITNDYEELLGKSEFRRRVNIDNTNKDWEDKNKKINTSKSNPRKIY